jgi:hypothetical protein
MKQERKKSNKVSYEVDGSAYPWGLRLTLNDEALKKLKMKADDFEYDGIYLLAAKVVVVGMSGNETSSGKETTVDLQITDMEIQDESDEALKLYEEAYEGGRK